MILQVMKAIGVLELTLTKVQLSIYLTTPYSLNIGLIVLNSFASVVHERKLMSERLGCTMVPTHQVQSTLTMGHLRHLLLSGLIQRTGPCPVAQIVPGSIILNWLLHSKIV